MKKFIIPYTIAFALSVLLSNMLSIRGIKPDFMIIFLAYFAMDQGSFRGVIIGFISGLLISFFDNNPTAGILPLSYSIIGYGIGFLKDSNTRLTTFTFNISLFAILAFGFFVYNYFLFDSIFYNDFPLFLVKWFKNMVYTFSILIILQFIIPLKK